MNLKNREEFPFLIRQMGYKRICEIGVLYGYFSQILSLSFPEHQVAIDIWDKYGTAEAKKRGIVDLPWTQGELKEMKENFQFWASRQSFDIDVIVDFSEEAVKQFDDEYFDFVYIDADHSYEEVTKDMEMWYFKVRDGGMIAGHDYVNNENFTKDAVDDFVRRHHKDSSFFITGEVSKFPVQKSFLL